MRIVTRLALSLVLATAALAQDRPVALVLDHNDKWTNANGAAALLTEAGFAVAALPLDKSPDTLDAALIVLGSFISELPAYNEYVRTHRQGLADFATKGGVVLQMTQADQTEAEVPFLPQGLFARRIDPDHGSVHDLAPGHPLTHEFVDADGPDQFPTFLGRPANWETFVEQKGFRTLLASGADGAHPMLLEAAVGRGRIVLASMFWDKAFHPTAVPSAEWLAKSRVFWRNVHTYVTEVQAGRAPEVVATTGFEPVEPLEWVPGSWTMVVLPDTQVYAMRYPQHFEAQTRWIVEQREARNIQYVLHLGDIVNNNNEPQWEVAQRAMQALNGQVPYALAPGNHDYGPGGNAATRDTLLNQYFPMAWFRDWPTLGGLFQPDQIDNSYHLFSAGGQDWLVLALEWGPRDQVVAWADQVMAQHPDRQAILITHAYLYNDSTRYDWATKAGGQHWNPHGYGTARQPGGVNDGEQLWQKLVSRHAGFRFTFNGHVLGSGQGRLSSRGEAGHVVHQILCNYQMIAEGGSGFLRLVEFLPDGKTVQFRSYSPSLDQYKTDRQHQFVLTLNAAD